MSNVDGVDSSCGTTDSTRDRGSKRRRLNANNQMLEVKLNDMASTIMKNLGITMKHLIARAVDDIKVSLCDIGNHIADHDILCHRVMSTLFWTKTAKALGPSTKMSSLAVI